MDLLLRLNKQAIELWQKHASCQNIKERELLLKQYKAALSQYLKHKEWLKALEA